MRIFVCFFFMQSNSNKFSNFSKFTSLNNNQIFMVACASFAFLYALSSIFYFIIFWNATVKNSLGNPQKNNFNGHFFRNSCNTLCSLAFCTTEWWVSNTPSAFEEQKSWLHEWVNNLSLFFFYIRAYFNVYQLWDVAQYWRFTREDCSLPMHGSVVGRLK